MIEGVQKSKLYITFLSNYRVVQIVRVFHHLPRIERLGEAMVENVFLWFPCIEPAMYRLHADDIMSAKTEIYWENIQHGITKKSTYLCDHPFHFTKYSTRAYNEQKYSIRSGRRSSANAQQQQGHGRRNIGIIRLPFESFS